MYLESQRKNWNINYYFYIKSIKNYSFYNYKALKSIEIGQDVIDIKYSGEPLAIAFNYKFVLEFLKIVESEEISVQLNTPLSATVFAPCSDEDYIYLVMPVQLRN